MAVDHASLSGFKQLEALAHERAGVACQRLGKGEERENAMEHLRHAVTLYDEWGGAAFVAHLKQKYNL